MYLGDARWPEVAARPGLLMIPLGSCEQHGPHLPLDTDGRIAVAVANAVAATRPQIRVAPVVAYGASGEHAGFAGTLSVGSEVLALMLVELARSADWAERVVFYNGHGGNAEGIRAAVRTLKSEGRHVVVSSPVIRDGDAHAGRTETSLMLAIAPDQVRMELAEGGALEPIDELMGRLRTGGVISVAPNGVLGDSTKATASEGEALLRSLVEALAAAVDQA
jgi:mycofactocin precursor peptide peptidase